MKIPKQIKYYDNLWSQRLPLNSLQLRRAVKVLDYFIDIKRKFKVPRILDLGCGDGRFTGFLGEFGNTDAIELSEVAVKEATKQHPHVNFIQGSALSYNFKKNYYDVVISQEVIEHLEDQQAYINVCHEVLKLGGYLIITTPNKRVFDNLRGGNWSEQPIENIMGPKEFKSIVANKLSIIKYDSVIVNFGNKNYFKLLNHKLVIGGSNRLGLNNIRKYFYSKLGYGLHQCILAKKIK